ncbi:MAG: polyribonucleotide nucleotidyltransferase [Patescibacteria group bacterium]
MHKQSFEIPYGAEVIRVESNDLAGQTNGSVMLSLGDTTVMAVALLGGANRYSDGGLSLRVDYEERYYARGAILGGRFNKREGKPSTEAILTARVIDRSIRPFFPAHFDREVQVVVTVLSLGEYDPDVLAINAASLALGISDIPWEGPIGAIRISTDSESDKLLVNPTFKERKRESNTSNSIIAGKGDAICMVECDAMEMDTDAFVALSEEAMNICGGLCREWSAIVAKLGKEKLVLDREEAPALLAQVFDELIQDKMRSHIEQVADREQMNTWKKEYREAVRAGEADLAQASDSYFDSRMGALVREAMVNEGKRIDGRTPTELRPLFAQAGGLPGRQHGTGIFYRGETHVLSVLTLGSIEDDVLYRHEMEVDGTERWMHHYNFPDYSVGEVGPMRSPRRREIGHGVLAQKAIARILPSEEEFPYAIRVVSEVMSSNGSTSMASTCATSLALWDGGVPMKKLVAGLACGMVKEGDKRMILVDILGAEDHFGDVDFKVAGTREGMTALQLDCKNHGIGTEEMKAILEASRQARLEILDTMEAELGTARELSPYVERISTYLIPEDKIGLIIGKGGVTIKRITRESEAKIDIKRDGTAHITGSNEAIARAMEMIDEILKSVA